MTIYFDNVDFYFDNVFINLYNISNKLYIINNKTNMRKLCVTFITLGKGTLVQITFKTSLKQTYSHIKH